MQTKVQVKLTIPQKRNYFLVLVLALALHPERRVTIQSTEKIDNHHIRRYGYILSSPIHLLLSLMGWLGWLLLYCRTIGHFYPLRVVNTIGNRPAAASAGVCCIRHVP